MSPPRANESLYLPYASPRKTRLTLPLAVGGHKTVEFRSVRSTKDTGDPAIVRLLQQKPIRPVVLRPHLSAGLPLNSLPTMRWIRRPCKALFSTHEEQGFGVLHGLRGTAHDHHVPLLEQGIRARFAPYDAVPAHRTDRGLRSAGDELCGGADDRPGV